MSLACGSEGWEQGFYRQIALYFVDLGSHGLSLVLERRCYTALETTALWNFTPNLSYLIAKQCDRLISEPLWHDLEFCNQKQHF